MFVESFYKEWENLPLNEKQEFAKKLVELHKEKLDKVLDELIEYCPELVLLMFYKDKTREDLCIKILKNNLCLLKDPELLNKIMYETTWSDEVLKEYYETIIELNEENIFYIIQYLIKNRQYPCIQKLSLSPNLETRGKVMIELLLEHEKIFTSIYDKPLITYLKYKNEIMPERYVSRLCYFISYLKPQEYFELRDFILANYERNDLAHYMINGDPYSIDDRTEEDKALQKELLKDRINDIYRKSISGKLDIFLKYSELLDRDILHELRKKVLPFLTICSEDMINILSSDLLNELIRMLDEHFENITGAECISYKGYGSTAQVFQLEDKVIKFCRCKYNKGTTRSITSYLIAPLIDSAYTYHQNGDIEYGIEIQRYLPKSLGIREGKVFNAYEKAFSESGLICEDLEYTTGNEYQNLRYLESYMDADCEDPESLPDWFKRDPVVLIDSDLVQRKK